MHSILHFCWFPIMTKLFLILAILFFGIVPLGYGQDVLKMQEQMKSLMSKEKQAALNKQEEQKVLLEKQKLLLIEKEKALLKLQFEKKRSALQHEKNEALSQIQRNKLQAQIQAALKDKRISDQQKAIYNTRKWVLYLVTLSILIITITVLIYLNQQKTKRLNRLVINQHKELEEIGLVKDRLFSVVGHDLRSPFNMLISLSALLKQGNVSAAKMTSYMGELEATLEHTSNLMDNLLLWAESQLQGYKPVLEQHDVSLTIDHVTNQQKTNASLKDITINNEVVTGTHAVCDANMVSIVLRNLLSNAIKFTPKGGMIKIFSNSENGYLHISVADNGAGLSIEKMDNFNTTVFHPHESTLGTAKEKGTGLGLLLCKTFTQLMNGRILVAQNISGVGCVFNIILPESKNV